MDVRLPCGFSMLIVGASGSGKSVFTKNLLKSKDIVMKNAPNRILWCYGVYQPLFDQLKNTIPNISFHNGIPSLEMLKSGNFILIIDDLMLEAQSNQLISDIFTKFCHHYNITCILIMQNLFPKGKQMRNISLNANYIVLMKNSRDKAQIRTLAAQMYPGNVAFLTKAFEDATRKPFSYLLLDCRNDSDDGVRVRTGILPHEVQYVYKPLAQ